MEIELTVGAEEDLAYWQKTGNKAILKRIKLIIANIQETPFDDIGKPEALKYNLSGKWSRRLSQGDRIIYQVVDDTLYIYSLKGHYK